MTCGPDTSADILSDLARTTYENATLEKISLLSLLKRSETAKQASEALLRQEMETNLEVSCLAVVASEMEQVSADCWVTENEGDFGSCQFSFA